MGAKIDLIGQTFGRLTVLEEGSKKNGKLYWKCKCECGNEVEVYGYSLRSGRTQSCGCLGKERRSNANSENLEGQTFGKLTVLKLDHKDKRCYWLCQCECGNTTIVSTTDLKSNHIKSCGCLRKENALKAHMIDLTNQKFGKLTALYPNWEYSKDKHGIYWHCQCECGNECDIAATQLSQGKTKSCGCLLKEVLLERNTKDKEVQLNKQYGYLKVVGDAGYEEEYGKRRHYSYCLCTHCGKIIKKRDNDLTNGAISCGCVGSRGEEKISEILKQNSINFEKEKTFFNFKDTNQPARYDFYILNKNYIIEYDGIQHFKITGGWGTEIKLKETQEHDKIKNQYCFDNNIPIIRIPYTHFDDLCLEDLLLETSKFIVNRAD